MEAVPSMDDLLDEVEEAVKASTSLNGFSIVHHTEPTLPGHPSRLLAKGRLECDLTDTSTHGANGIGCANKTAFSDNENTSLDKNVLIDKETTEPIQLNEETTVPMTEAADLNTAVVVEKTIRVDHIQLSEVDQMNSHEPHSEMETDDPAYQEALAYLGLNEDDSGVHEQEQENTTEITVIDAASLCKGDNMMVEGDAEAERDTCSTASEPSERIIEEYASEDYYDEPELPRQDSTGALVSDQIVPTVEETLRADGLSDLSKESLTLCNEVDEWISDWVDDVIIKAATSSLDIDSCDSTSSISQSVRDGRVIDSAEIFSTNDETLQSSEPEVLCDSVGDFYDAGPISDSLPKENGVMNEGEAPSCSKDDVVNPEKNPVAENTAPSFGSDVVAIAKSRKKSKKVVQLEDSETIFVPDEIPEVPNISDFQQHSPEPTVADVRDLAPTESCAVTEPISHQDEESVVEEDHAETAIEVAEGFDFSALQQPSTTTSLEGGSRPRFRDEVIAVVHDMALESDPMRLTESELQLGKTKPYWIPDADCILCMLCSSKFSLLNRRHHCRACGRVLCGACCSERATLQYLGDDEKKNKARVCQPCMVMLERIREYENNQAVDDAIEASSTSRTRGVLKSRAAAEAVPTGEAVDLPGTSSISGSPATAFSLDRKRSVVFRDGVRPGDATASGSSEPTANNRSIRKKPQRKRVHVARKLASLKMEEELASLLPPSETGVAEDLHFLVRCPDGAIRTMHLSDIDARLAEGLQVEVLLKRNLAAFVHYGSHPVNQKDICSVSSRGFHAVGVDELVFIWEPAASSTKSRPLPFGVLLRVAEMFESCLESEHSGVRMTVHRLDSLHTSTHTPIPPTTKHVLVHRPTTQDMSSLRIPWPTYPCLVCVFVLDEELVWALAAPNRLLFRLGLLSAWYPYLMINPFERSAVYCKNTNNSVLKVFTDFRDWTYRMAHVADSSAVLRQNSTCIRLPVGAKEQMRSIVTCNRRLVSWACDVAQEADSHLVCVEQGETLGTQILSKTNSRAVMGASFVILDAGLKEAKELFQVSVVEDGVAIRMGAELLEKVVDALSAGQDWSATSGESELRIEWSAVPPSNSQLVSPIDGLYLGDRYQYGLSLARALSTSIQVESIPDYAIRLSHVFQIPDGRIAADDEAKIFSVAEMLCRDTSRILETYLPALVALSIDRVAIRTQISESDVGIDVAPWDGLESEHANFVASLDALVPVLFNLLEYLPGGVHLEIHLAIISARDPVAVE